MRIVAGQFRGRVIDAPSGNDTRPTTDRVREALFSSLYSLRGGFEGAYVLDAFAGSGALGLEAVSRGAQGALFYERDAKAAAVLKKNGASCKLTPAQATVVQRDIMAAPPASGSPFDIVFLDPPYAYDAASVFSLVRTLADAGLLAGGATVVYEHALKSADEVSAAAEAAGFSVLTTKKYGKTAVTTCEETS